MSELPNIPTPEEVFPDLFGPGAERAADLRGLAEMVGALHQRVAELERPPAPPIQAPTPHGRPFQTPESEYLSGPDGTVLGKPLLIPEAGVYGQRTELFIAYENWSNPADNSCPYVRCHHCTGLDGTGEDAVTYTIYLPRQAARINGTKQRMEPNVVDDDVIAATKLPSGLWVAVGNGYLDGWFGKTVMNINEDGGAPLAPPPGWQEVSAFQLSVPVGYKSGDADFGTMLGTGGAKTHQHAAAADHQHAAAADHQHAAAADHQHPAAGDHTHDTVVADKDGTDGGDPCYAIADTYTSTAAGAHQHDAAGAHQHDAAGAHQHDAAGSHQHDSVQHLMTYLTVQFVVRYDNGIAV